MNSQPTDPHWVELASVVTRAEHIQNELARLHAERAELCASALDLVADRVAQRAAARVAHRGAIGDDIPLREVVAELGAALRVGDQTVRNWLGDGAALVHRYRATLDALREGRIDERHASAIVDGGMPLTDAAACAEYERRMLVAAETETAVSLRRIGRVLAARLQPELVDERQRHAHDARRVRIHDLEDELARLIADLPATLGRAAYDRLTELALTLDGADDCADEPDDAQDAADERTIDQRRADALSSLLLCSVVCDADPLDAVQGCVQITIPVLSLAGLDNEPALLAGHGPIDADTARRIAANAPVWERVLVHPHTGELLACDRYRVPAEVRRLLASRDQHCRWLGCRRDARRCDADHTVAFAEGGTTSADNLSLFCRRHHRLKHASPWAVRNLGGGTMEFSSPTGRTYRNDCPPVVEFVPRLQRWRLPYDAGDPAPF